MDSEAQCDCGYGFIPPVIVAPPKIEFTKPGIQRARGSLWDSTSLTKALIGWLWAYLGVAVLGVLGSAIALLTGPITKLHPGSLTPMNWVMICVSIPYTLIAIVTGVVFLMWIYRANEKARSQGAKGMTFTPGWSVGYYFIPILNLWKPYQAMQEIWQASKNPILWASQKPSTLLPVWWGAWLASGILENAYGVAYWHAHSATELMGSEIISVLCNCVEVPLCLVEMRLVREIGKMQDHWSAQPVHGVCTLCQQPFAASEMIVLNGSWFCAQCKPVMLQRIKEGLIHP